MEERWDFSPVSANLYCNSAVGAISSSANSDGFVSLLAPSLVDVQFWVPSSGVCCAYETLGSSSFQQPSRCIFDVPPTVLPVQGSSRLALFCN